MQLATRIILTNPDLFEDFQVLGSLTYEFTVDEPSFVEVTGHIDCAHRGVYNTADKAVMVGFRAKLNGQFIDGSATGCNIYNRTDHYAIVPIAFSLEVPAGTHTIEIFGRSASTAAPGKNGLAEVKDGLYNCVTYKVFPMSIMSEGTTDA